MKRIQRKRTKGWRMPENTVYVGRPTKWGNPFSWEWYLEQGWDKKGARGQSVIDFKSWLKSGMWADAQNRLNKKGDRGVILNSLDELRGKDLACWCPLDHRCHADVLIELIVSSPSLI